MSFCVCWAASNFEPDEVGEKIVDLVCSDGLAPVFDRRERVMIRGVLRLAERTVHTIMTPSDEIDRFDLRQSHAELESALINSPHSRLPVIRNGR